MDDAIRNLLEKVQELLQKAAVPADYSHDDGCTCAPCEALAYIVAAHKRIEAALAEGQGEPLYDKFFQENPGATMRDYLASKPHPPAQGED